MALARKILCIVHHLLVKEDDHVEEGSVQVPRLRFGALSRVPLEEMAEVLLGAGYVVVARDRLLDTRTFTWQHLGSDRIRRKLF